MPKLGEALRAMVSDKEEALEVKGRPESVLMNPTRQRIFETICHSPASRLRTIARRLEMNATVVQFHLRKMKSHAYIDTFTRGKVIVYYPSDLHPTEQDLVLLSLIADETGRELVKLVVVRPGLTPREMSLETDHCFGSVRRLLLDMESNGLVAIVIDGRHSRVFPGDGLVKLERRSHQLLRAMRSRLMRRLARDRLSPVVEMDERREGMIILKVGRRTHRLRIPSESLMPWTVLR